MQAARTEDDAGGSICSPLAMTCSECLIEPCSKFPFSESSSMVTTGEAHTWRGALGAATASKLELKLIAITVSLKLAETFGGEGGPHARTGAQRALGGHIFPSGHSSQPDHGPHHPVGGARALVTGRPRCSRIAARTKNRTARLAMWLSTLPQDTQQRVETVPPGGIDPGMLAEALSSTTSVLSPLRGNTSALE